MWSSAPAVHGYQPVPCRDTPPAAGGGGRRRRTREPLPGVESILEPLGREIKTRGRGDRSEFPANSEEFFARMTYGTLKTKAVIR